MNTKRIATTYALLAAALYAVSLPLSKLLLTQVSPTMMAAFLYLGAGLGLYLCRLLSGKRETADPLTRSELPCTIGMVVLDIAAPILLMLGLERTNSANVSLLNNFEIVATSVIALCLFGEAISRRLWAAIALVTLSSMILSFGDAGSLKFSVGSLFVLLACVCWGFENNCTRKISGKDPLEIVVIKGFGSGLGALAIALVLGEKCPAPGAALCALVLGFVAYGLSIFFYIHAQRRLGAAKTSAYYAVSPFIGTALSLLIFREWPAVSFWVALAIMGAGAYLASTD